MKTLEADSNDIKNEEDDTKIRLKDDLFQEGDKNKRVYIRPKTLSNILTFFTKGFQFLSNLFQ